MANGFRTASRIAQAMAGKPKRPAVPVRSEHEERFAQHLKALGLPVPLREYQFDDTSGHKWRFDFAWPQYRVAVEIEGGHWVSGRHNRGAGFQADCYKYNSAALAGWRVLRGTADMVASGDLVRDLERLLKLEVPYHRVP